MNTSLGNPVKMGVTAADGAYNFSVRALEDEIVLELYAPGQKKPEYSIKLDSSYKFGDIFAVRLDAIDLEDYYYRYMSGGRYIPDLYSKMIVGTEKFGSGDRNDLVLSKVQIAPFDWKGDVSPALSMDETILYKLHVRGFTKSRTSGVEPRHRGCFTGIIEKLPYLKELGVTTLELMPAYEFDEASRFLEPAGLSADAGDRQMHTHRRRINYWGYQGGYYFAPKAAYTSAAAVKAQDYTTELKELIRQLHRNHMEIIMEFYFPHEDAYVILDCLRYWVTQYHIDGVHLYCDECRLNEVLEDPVLSRTKIFMVYWNGERRANGCKNIGNYNTGFSEAAKRLLKGDENQLPDFARASRANPRQSANINYITNHNGFTLMDLVCYDRKHNEANGEDNRDGENFNYSWNCGVEGPSNKKKINELRMAQIRNAFLMLLTAQGTPLILAGDEFGNSQGGNNNPYCIDGETTWLEWKKTIWAGKITEFVRQAIQFRKEYGILHMEEELEASDSLSCGYPDVSYHGDNAWFSRMESFERSIGIMYCCKYTRQNPQDEVLYIGYNLHWEPHKLALPHLPEGNQWTILLTTNDRNSYMVDSREVLVPPRSIIVLSGDISRPVTEKPIKDKKVKNKRKGR